MRRPYAGAGGGEARFDYLQVPTPLTLLGPCLLFYGPFPHNPTDTLNAHLPSSQYKYEVYNAYRPHRLPLTPLVASSREEKCHCTLRQMLRGKSHLEESVGLFTLGQKK